MKKIFKNQQIYFSKPTFAKVLKALNLDSQVSSKKPAKKIIMICDKKLKSKGFVKSWPKNQALYFVSAGEDLKNIDNLPHHVHKVFKKIGGSPLTGFVSLGGGSVGDFTGFLASIYKRGRPVVHIPTTWLSAMDSAHGGKTALNVGGIKNGLGSYHFPKAVFIDQRFLSSLSKIEKHSALGELLKMALIEGGMFYKNLLKKYNNLLLYQEQKKLKPIASYKRAKKPITIDTLLCHFLPLAIKAKIKIVSQDPYEQKGPRTLLNLGHTIGHVLESYFKLPHGVAVMYGIIFSAEFCQSHFHLPNSFFVKQLKSFLPPATHPLSFYLKLLPKNILQNHLLQDKKREGQKTIKFVFVKGPGKVFTEKVSIQEIISAVRRQTAAGEELHSLIEA